MLEGALLLCDVIHRTVTQVLVVEALRDGANRRARACRVVKRLEGMYSLLARQTFEDLGTNRITVIMEGIVRHLEKTLDSAEDAANVLESATSSNTADRWTTASCSCFQVVVVALVFDFINGFHDSANSIATVVATRVLSPRFAVLCGFLQFSRGIRRRDRGRHNLRQGTDRSERHAVAGVRQAFLGAIVWNLITWWLGLPSSSSHALMGGYAGAALAKAGFSAIIVAGWIKPILGIVVSPLLGMILGLLLSISLPAVASRRPVPPVAVPEAATGVGGTLFACPWVQRCPEDDGHHRVAARVVTAIVR